jgi:O-antigen ligase/tetratricopeptide (TPR) repeat protein
LRWSVALLPLLCVALGGGTERWSQGTVLVLLGLLLMVAPPRLSLGWKLNCVLAGLFALALTGFLPARWFGVPAWRISMVEDFGFQLPATLSPQPWLTAERCVLFLAGLCWFYLLATINWTAGERARAGQLFGAGVVALAGLFLLLLRLGIVVPIWPTERHFGPFPNRNQTADFLAIGALPVLACVQLAWRAGRRVAAAGWVVGWLVIALAAFTSFSRAGVILLFGGTACYVVVQALRAWKRQSGANAGAGRGLDRWRNGALGVSLVAILLSAFLLFGGETLDRFTPKTATATVQAVTTEFRLRIQADALQMIRASPWCGVGLGNFGAVFPLFRVRSALPARAIHPESDWLWMVAELGWPALGLVLAGLALLVPGIWPWRRAPDRPLRTAAALALPMFALHSFVDVSAHRLGTCFCAVFVLGLALRGEGPEMPIFRVPARWPGPLFRVLGVLLAAAGGVWIQEARHVLLLPGEEGVDAMQGRAEFAAANRDYAGVERVLDQAVAWAPLDWTSYFTRGGARAYLAHYDDAAADFQRARLLEPFFGELPADEARTWAVNGQAALAVNALVEACRREPGRAAEFMNRVDNVASHDSDFWQQMGRIARAEPALLLPFLEQLRPPQSGDFIAACLRTDPDLQRLPLAQQTRFFRAWAQFGDAAGLAVQMGKRPQWQAQGWRWWADACARGGAYEEACRIVTRFAVPPAVPSAGNVEPLPGAELAQQAEAAPGDAALALRLYRAQKQAGDLPAALTTLRRIRAVPGAPAYFLYLQALTAAEAGDWAASWNAWQDYLGATGVL